MTRFHNSEVNLKSSVYNLAGENLFEQFSAYNSMSCHIRKVLLAKSVVDSRNNRYINEKKRRSKLQLSKRYSLDNFIDRLAYDTKHHPIDLLKMNLDEYCSRHIEKENTDNIDQSQLKMQANDTENNMQTICRNRSALKSKKNNRNKSCTRKHIKRYQEPLHYIIQRCDDEPLFVTCGDPSEMSTNGLNANSGTSSGCTMQENNASSALPCSLENYNNKRAEIEAKEDARYVEFAYDITCDIIKCGLYTDKELNELFKKHLQRYKTTLDLNKMLREIYRLKTFLNMADDSDESDDDIECCNNDQVWQSEVRPPTPPKVLDDNKVIGKLLSYQKLMENQHNNKEPNSGKSVVLIDANPELLITERDVLTSLLEVGIDPKQAENICKSLQNKSMETVLENMAELKIENDSSEKMVCAGCNRSCCDGCKVEAENGTENETENETDRENKSSNTDDLTSKQDETIQTQSSPDTLVNDNYTEPMCATFSQLRQECLPLNVDEVIQTEAIQIDVGSRIRMNKYGVQITEVFQSKEKFIHENMDISDIAQTDILAWSRDKIAAIKANASDVPEKPVKNTEYDYRIPITKSTQKLLSTNKKKSSLLPSRSRDQMRSETQRKRSKSERSPQRPSTSKKPIKPRKSSSVKSKQSLSSPKKGRRSTQPGTSTSKLKISSNVNVIKAPINQPVNHQSITQPVNQPTDTKPPNDVSTSISHTHVSHARGICITKISNRTNNKDNRRCIAEADIIYSETNETSQQPLDKSEAELDTLVLNETETESTVKDVAETPVIEITGNK